MIRPPRPEPSVLFKHTEDWWLARMLTGAIVLVAPTIAFLFAFGGWISWWGFGGIALVCVMVGSAMSIAK